MSSLDPSLFKPVPSPPVEGEPLLEGPPITQGPQDISTGRWIGDVGKGMVGAAAQEGIVEMPQGLWNLLGAPAVRYAKGVLTGSYEPDAFQSTIDLRKTLLPEEERAHLEAVENDTEAFFRGMMENVGGVVGFIWGAPAKVMGRAGRVAFSPARAVESMAVKALDNAALRKAVIEATEMGATKLTGKELAAIYKAQKMYRAGDAVNAWKNLALAGVPGDAAQVGGKLKQFLLGRLSPDGKLLSKGFSVRAAEEMQGFAAMEFLKSPRDPETGEMLPGVNLDARIGAAFSAAMLAPIYTAVGTAAQSMGGKLQDKGWSQRHANVAKGALEGLGFSAFEIGQLADGIEAAGNGDYKGLMKWLEHAAGSSLGFAFAHGVSPKDLRLHRVASPEDYMPTKEYLGSMEKAGIPKDHAQVLWMSGVTTPPEGGALRPPRGTDRSLLVEKGPDGEILFHRTDRHGNTSTKKGEDALQSILETSRGYRMSMMQGRKLEDLGFAPAGADGVYTSPNTEWNVRLDRSGKVMEQAVGAMRGAKWDPPPESGESFFRERYGINSKAELNAEAASKAEFSPDYKALASGLTKAKQNAYKLVDFAVDSKALKRGSSVYRELMEIMDPMDNLALRDPFAAAELGAALSSPEILGGLQAATKVGDAKLFERIVMALGTVKAGINGADVAQSIAAGDIIYGREILEALRTAQKAQEAPVEEAPKEAPKEDVWGDARAEDITKAEKRGVTKETGETLAESGWTPAEVKALETQIRDVAESRVVAEEMVAETVAKREQTLREPESWSEAPKVEGQTKDISTWTVKALRAYAKDTGISLKGTKKKADILDTIDEHRLAVAAGEREVFSPDAREAMVSKIARDFMEVAPKSEAVAEVQRVAEDPVERAKVERTFEELLEENSMTRQLSEFGEALDRLSPVQARAKENWARADALLYAAALGNTPSGLMTMAAAYAAGPQNEWGTTLPSRKVSELAIALRTDRSKSIDRAEAKMSRIYLDIVKNIPKRLEREEITFWIQKTGNPYRPGDTFEALDTRISQATKDYATKNLRGLLDGLFERSVDLGLMDDATYRENYITQMWKKKRSIIPMSDNDIAEGHRILFENTKYAKHRKWKTYASGFEFMAAHGFEPKYTEIQDVIRSYHANLSRTEANVDLLTNMKALTADTGLPLVSKKSYQGYSRIEGHPQTKGLWFHPEVYKQMNKVFEWRGTSGKWMEAASNLWFHSKASTLRYNFFHMWSLGFESQFASRGLAAFGDYIKFSKDILSGRLSEKIDMKIGDKLFKGDELLDFASKAGLTWQTPHEYKKGFIESAVDRYVIGQERKGEDPKVSRLASKVLKKVFNDVLWEGAFPTLKLNAFAKKTQALSKNLGKIDKLTGREITLDAVAEIAASHVNDAFGGQNWDRYQNAFFASRNNRQLMQFALLSPDWTISNLRVALRALPGVEKNPMARRLSQQYVARTIATMIVSNSLAGWLSYHVLMTDEERAELDKDGINPANPFDMAGNPKLGGIPFSGFRTGKEFGQWRVAKTFKQFNEIMRMGADPREVLTSKASPIMKKVVENFWNSTSSGYPVPWESESSFWDSIPTRILDAATAFIPITLQGAYRSAADLDKKKRASTQFMMMLPIGAETTSYHFKETMIKSITAYATEAQGMDTDGKKIARDGFLERIRALKKVAARNNVNYAYTFRSATAFVQRSIMDEVVRAMDRGEDKAVERGFRMLGNIGVDPRQAWTSLGKKYLNLVNEGKARWTIREIHNKMVPMLSHMDPDDIAPIRSEKAIWDSDYKIKNAMDIQNAFGARR